MKQHLLGTLKVTIGLVLIVVLITGGIELFSSTQNRGAEQLHDFVAVANMFHGKIEGSALLEDFDTLLQLILDETPEDTTEINTLIINRSLSARGYTEQFNWLYPPTTEALEILGSLIREGRLIQSCYAKLYLAWSAKQSGDELSCVQYCEEARELFEKAISLRAQNKIDMDNLKLQAEHDLAQ